MNILKKLFRHNTSPQEEQEGVPLRIEGVPDAPMTAEPDDAELAAQAVLELMRPAPGPSLLGRGKATGRRDSGNINSFKRKGKSAEEVTTPIHQQGGVGGGSAYYHALADKIRTAQEAARLRTLRFLAFVEQELAKKELPLTGPGSLGLLEAELMKRLDVIERVGGELKTRWQHCVAQVVVRLMQATGHTETTETTEKETTTDSTDSTDSNINTKT